ncbi:hypothetical protein EJB05_25834, partial [Eragrostis curvula]
MEAVCSLSPSSASSSSSFSYRRRRGHRVPRNVVDYAMDIHKSLHGTDDVPSDMVARQTAVLARLNAPIVSFLQNPRLVPCDLRQLMILPADCELLDAA